MTKTITPPPDLVTARLDLQRIIRQRPVQRLRLILRRAHPNIALLLGGRIKLLIIGALRVAGNTSRR
jgi:hypothetical protein